MQVELLDPSEALRPYVRVFYRASCDSVTIEGVERVDLGQLRFWLRGRGTIEFPNGRESTSETVMLTAPAMVARRYRAEAPFDCFGAALRPRGWGALIGIDARRAADAPLDCRALLGDAIFELRDRMRELSSLAEMAQAAEPFLMARIRPVPEAHARLIDQVFAWENSPHPVIEDLYAVADMSPRQVARLINRYFGGPPKFLERKFRAMRAAVRIARGADPAETAEMFYDQPHMIRELKRFIGHTPRSLRDSDDPLLSAALTLERDR